MMRKKLSDIAWNVTEPEYRADPAYSYSKLSTFLSLGFNGLDSLDDRKSSPSLTFGSMVDTLLTDGQEAFDQRFFVAELPELSEQLENVTKTLYSLYEDTYSSFDEIPDDVLSSVAEECGYYKGQKYASLRAKKVRESCGDYYNMLFMTADKELVSDSDYNDAKECVNVLRNNDMTMAYFAADTDDVEHYYQLKFKDEWNHISMRCMCDLLVVNHRTKTVYLCDLKTSSEYENEFFKSFIKWHYWIQAQLYWYLVRKAMDNDEYFKDFRLMDCRFIVINRKTLLPLVWEYADTQKTDTLHYGRNEQIECRNWREIVEELDMYLSDRPLYPSYVKRLNSIIERLNLM